MTSDRYRPRYVQLADILRNQIRNGRLRQGQDLPSEITLCEEYELGRAAVRQALAVLRHEGLITTEQGRPSYVRESPPRRPVVLDAGDEVVCRTPSADERLWMGLEPGVPLVEVRHANGAVQLHRGDRVIIRPPADGEAQR
jgi:GntR family transcriptional regulator